MNGWYQNSRGGQSAKMNNLTSQGGNNLHLGVAKTPAHSGYIFHFLNNSPQIYILFQRAKPTKELLEDQDVLHAVLAGNPKEVEPWNWNLESGPPIILPYPPGVYRQFLTTNFPG